ncbi:hypothetical protein RFI_02989 [Reticulomyxa filosa]|uniref:Uncharacterized protein n=1 Tax=Reticulomyxa filosa TaxID=46433 RepID=X6P6F0_RETFI|nr:hypothetical protein RFI_02989 [Reticulomyxa filosa]|eukprot:ETO34105.1 hypothetical protein RFI_02989 [Reticulomyxa filosa]
MQSFTSAIKNGYIEANSETIVFEKTDNTPGVITEQWFTGIFDERTIVLQWLKKTPTLLGIPSGSHTRQARILLCPFFLIIKKKHSEGPFCVFAFLTNWQSPQKKKIASGGLYNTYRIPFLSSIKIGAFCIDLKNNNTKKKICKKITIENWQAGTFWYIVRGVTNYPIILGDLQLPANGRLYLYKNENVELEPDEFIALANISGTAGALFGVTIQANSTDYNYLEACMRVKIDSQTNYQFLSSGTEDFFLSAYYFDRGLYHDDNAGCTFLDGKGAMSAYKFFSRDPILFTKGLQLVWRCGETDDSNGCPTSFNPDGTRRKRTPRVQLANTLVTTYTWVYQYTLN